MLSKNLKSDIHPDNLLTTEKRSETMNSLQTSVPLTLRRNVSWTFLGNLVYAGTQWGMLTVMAKIGSPEMVGQFSLATAICTPVYMFANLQLRNIQATDARNRYTFDDYFSLRMLSTTLAWFVIVGIALLSEFSGMTTLVIVFLGVANAVESLSDVFYGQIQQHERMDRIAISMMAKGVVSFVVFGSVVWLTGNLLFGMWR